MQGCIYYARCDGIEANVLLCVLTGKTQGDSVQPALCGHRKRHGNAGDGIVGQCGRNCRHASTVTLRQHLRYRKLNNEDEPFEVGRCELSKVLRRVLGKWFRHVDTGVGHDVIN
jgi:hypothetical protein